MLRSRKTSAEKAARTRRRNLKRKQLGLRPQVVDLEVLDGGREVLSLSTSKGFEEYLRRVDEMTVRQGYKCPECGLALHPQLATFDHEAGRGMGGGKRDDRVVLPDGRWINAALHYICNGRKGSRKGYKYPEIARGEVRHGSA